MAFIDLRSMRSMQSQSRSQHRILNSQASLRQRVLASNQASNVVSGEAKAPPENEVDVLTRLSEEELTNLVKMPPALEAGDEQAKLNLLSMDRMPLRSDVSCPEWVLVHIYNLSQTFVGANQVLTFSEGFAIGGAFHVGVEVYGAEWSYGVYGVACDPPRAETAHVYECSVFVGATVKRAEEVAGVLFSLCQEWRGRNYDVLSHNCCSFGRRFVEALGVGPMPLWIDRFARTLHGGREGLRNTVQGIKKTVMEDVPVMYEAAKPHVVRFASDASVWMVAQKKQAGDALHKVVTHDVPVMMETAQQTARPYVEKAKVVVHKAVAEDLPAAMAATQEAAAAAHAVAQPHVEQAVNTAMSHTSNAMSSAGEVLSEYGEMAKEHLQLAADSLHQQLFGEEETSSDEVEPEVEREVSDLASEVTQANSSVNQQIQAVQAAPVSSLPRPMAKPSGMPLRVSSLQGDEAHRTGYLWPNANQVLQSPTPRIQAAQVVSQPRRFISAAPQQERLVLPSRLPSADAFHQQNQVPWSARPLHSIPRPVQQVSWMPPLPRPPC